MRRATNSAAELERNLGLPGVLGSSSASPFERRRRAKVLLAPIRVIRFWYFEHHTLEMIGRKENVTRGRIQQIRDKALRRCLAVTRHRIGLLVLPILERMAFAGGELHITKLEQVFPGFDARLLLLALHIVGERDFFFRRGEVLTRKGQGRRRRKKILSTGVGDAVLPGSVAVAPSAADRPSSALAGSPSARGS